jgi:hypothetical protein
MCGVTGHGATTPTEEEAAVEVAKETVLSFIEQRGDTGRLDEARETLPDPIDTDRDEVLLAKLGVDFDDINDAEGPNISPSQADRHTEAERAAEEESDRKADRQG